MEASQNNLNHTHKLPPKLVELLKVAESTTLVGFGATEEQRDFMLLLAILDNQPADFFEALKQDINEYFLTLSIKLSDSAND